MRRIVPVTLVWALVTACTSAETTKAPNPTVNPPRGDASCISFEESGASVSGCQLVAAAERTCLRATDGTVSCWGETQLGGDTGDAGAKTARTPVPGLTGVEQLVSGSTHNCAIVAGGHLWCWGENDRGQLGIGSTATQSGVVEAKLCVPATRVALGFRHTCIVDVAGRVWCWGLNAFDQIGVGTKAYYASPEYVAAAGDGYVDISASNHTTCGIKRDSGEVWCWGYNKVGEVGSGSTLERVVTPERVAGLTGVTAVRGGRTHLCALKSDGTVWCWGHNNSKQLGAESTGMCQEAGSGSMSACSRTPVQVSAVTGAVQLAVGEHHSCAVTSGGALYCWGGNTNSAINGTTTSLLPPTLVDVGGPVSAVAVGSAHTCARRTDGGLYCWGSAVDGQIGLTGEFVCNCVRTPTALPFTCGEAS